MKSNAGALDSSFSWAHLIACCLVWSGRVVDYLDPVRTRRNDLRRAARNLGIKPELPVHYQAHQRGG